MPDFDGGHYFLTVLAPVRTDTVLDPIVGRTRSHRHTLAQKLALLAAGRQTAASPADAWKSPFAANTLNHFVRLAIIDGPAWNGRSSGDTLLGVVRKVDPLAPQSDDRLTNPFLLFSADIDAQGPDGPEAALRRYTDTLWTTMHRDLSEIFGHCLGYDPGFDAAGFHGWIKRCQVETTMPFHDYWMDDDLRRAGGALPTGAAKAAAVVAVGALAVWLLAALLAALLWVFGVQNRFAETTVAVAAWGIVVVPTLVAILALVLLALYRTVTATGVRPLPTAPSSDLPSVLKALFLQQQFTRFAIDAQGLDAAALHAQFGAFLAAVQPSAAAPSQPPGEVMAPSIAWPG